MRFCYRHFGQGVLRPVIPITVEHGDRSVTYEVLLNSAADINVFDSEIGWLLGLDVTAGTRQVVAGIAGQTAVAFSHHLTLSVGGWRFLAEVAFIPRPAGESVPGVLGGRGFFDRFLVKFDRAAEEIDLRPRIGPETRL